MDRISPRSPHKKHTIKLTAIEQSPSVSKEVEHGKGFYYTAGCLMQAYIVDGPFDLFAQSAVKNISVRLIHFNSFLRSWTIDYRQEMLTN